MTCLGPSNRPVAAASARHLLEACRFLLFFLAASIILFSVPPSYADQIVSLNTVANVNEGSLISAVSDLQGYPMIFPDNIKSVKVLDNNTNLVEINAGLDGIFFNTEAVWNRTATGTYTVTVISGDLKGTTLVTRLNKTWGFDGAPDMGTRANLSLDLKTTGVLSWMVGLVPESSLSYALQDSFARFVDYAEST